MVLILSPVKWVPRNAFSSLFIASIDQLLQYFHVLQCRSKQNKLQTSAFLPYNHIHETYGKLYFRANWPLQFTGIMGLRECWFENKMSLFEIDRWRMDPKMRGKSLVLLFLGGTSATWLCTNRTFISMMVSLPKHWMMRRRHKYCFRRLVVASWMPSSRSHSFPLLVPSRITFHEYLYLSRDCQYSLCCVGRWEQNDCFHCPTSTCLLHFATSVQE